MPDSDARDYVHLRTCVVFWEAVTWIAQRDFSLPENRIGPRQLSILPIWEDEQDDDGGRYELAHELLIDRAAKGKVRLYARDGWSELLEEGQSLSFPLELSAEFVKKAEYVCDPSEGPSLYVAEQQGYSDIVVDYSDLIGEFWGEPGRENQDALNNQQTRQPCIRRLTAPQLRRRGRRPQYAWPDFAAELVRRLLSGPVFNQAALERHMQEWCAVNWNAEPSTSELRYWVGPAFKAANAARSVGNSRPSPEMAEPPPK